MPFDPLPIDDILPDIAAHLRRGNSLLVSAAPGAGKTTKIPLALLDAPWLAGQKIIMLEPRRVAARAAARRMAAMLGEKPGETVGYRVRLDRAIGPKTRIEVVTDGLFLRQLQDDPSLPGVGAVLFDEFHERSLEVDEALAFTLEARDTLRPDLRVIVMSATLDAAPLKRLFGAAIPHVISKGRSFPVETRYLTLPYVGRLESATTRMVTHALAVAEGDILAFLPGAGEIRRTADLIQDQALPSHIDLHLLYGDLPAAQQDAALRPAPPGRRKIILASPIAESSLTVDGVRIVIDSGLRRRPRFDPRSGLTRLETGWISQASATQRQGRAGRQQAGWCFRLWTEEQQRQLIPFDAPEISEADLTSLALDLMQWGKNAAATLRWADAPPPGALAQARQVLIALGACDEDETLTPLGKTMTRLGTHPRLATMMVRADALGLGATACAVAALLEERDPMRDPSRDRDLRDRIAALTGSNIANIDKAALRRIDRLRDDWCRRLRIDRADPIDPDASGLIAAFAFPDRVAQARPGKPGQFLLANGRGATMPPQDPLAREEYLTIASLDAGAVDAKIFLAAPVSIAQIKSALADRLRSEDRIGWDEKQGAVIAERRITLGSLILETGRLAAPNADDCIAAILSALRQGGIGQLPWTEALHHLRHRVAFLRQRQPDEEWPDLSDPALLERLDQWLAPYLPGITRRSQFPTIDLDSALKDVMGRDRLGRLNKLAPDSITLPSGRTRRLDYESGEPVLALKLQDAFGFADTPSILNGQWKLLIHLLSPAGRPLQVTRDLAGFWAGSYRQVRAEMRGRYPKHAWPEDPRNYRDNIN